MKSNAASAPLLEKVYGPAMTWTASVGLCNAKVQWFQSEWYSTLGWTGNGCCIHFIVDLLFVCWLVCLF